MDANLETTEILDNQQTAQETPENTPEPKLDESGNPIETPAAEEKPKPWKKGPPQHVPYDRFSEVNNRAKTAEQRAAELEARLAAIEAAQKPAEPAPKGPVEPDIADYDDFAQYQAARDKYLETKFRGVVETEFQTRQQQEQAARREQAMVSTFRERVAEAQKSIPDLQEALGYLARFGEYIHPRIQEVLFSHENGPELAYHIAGNEDLLRKTIEDPISALVEFGRFRPSDAGYRAPAEDAEVPPTPAPPVPKTIKGRTTTPDLARMPMSEYRRYMANKGR